MKPVFTALLMPLLAWTSFAESPPASAQPSQSRPNVLFVAIDDLNDWIGGFDGNPQVRTPNFDKFHADGGMAMFNAHSPATVCCPSRTALLTGVHAHKTGVYGNTNNLKHAPKAQDLVTLPEYFSDNGYYSLSMGKIFHKHPSPGDTDGAKTESGQWAFDEWHKNFPGIGVGDVKRPVNGLPNLPGEKRSYHYTAFDWGPTIENDETKMSDYLTASWAADQLLNRDFDKPFFMAIGISKPHLTWYIPQKYFDLYPLDEIVLPQSLRSDLDDIVNDKGRPIYEPSTAWLRAEKYGRHNEAVRAYMAAVSFVDDCIGVLLDGLARSRHADNTIVVIWGDHGWYLGEKLRYGKTQLWQEACRVPLLFKVPGVTPGNKRCMGLVNLIDLYPTLVELCDLPANPENDGRSFASLLHDPDMDWKYPTLTTNGYLDHRIYDGRFSYISHGNNGAEELYDHKKDPMEWVNLANDPEYASIKAQLKALLPGHNEKEGPRNPS